jgi:hypothetical protein
LIIIFQRENCETWHLKDAFTGKYGGGGNYLKFILSHLFLSCIYLSFY